MNLRTSARRSWTSFPLRSAVLCVDCESVTSGRFDTCPVCGSGSVFSIAPMLGGTLGGPEARFSVGESIRFKVDINIGLTDISGKDMNTVVAGITEFIGLKIGLNRAALHIDVQPATEPARVSAENGTAKAA